jgi:Ca2+-binding RTX toxin-like protein
MRGLAVALVMSCAVIAAMGGAPASAAVSCNLAGTTLTITLGAAGDGARVARSGSDIRVLENGPDPVCSGATATVTNTDLIAVNDSSGADTSLIVSFLGGFLGPGATDEPGLSDEIELLVDMGGGGSDSLALIGSGAADVWRLGETGAGNGVNLNARESGVVAGLDFDLEYSGVDGLLGLNAVEGDDRIFANGGPEFAGPLTMGIHYRDILGGSANDTIVGGDGNDVIDAGPGSDDVRGGAGDDRFVDVVGQSDDDLDGGAGVDSIEYEPPPGASRLSLRVDLRLTSRQDTGVLGRDALSGIEDVFGGNGDDVLIGTDESNTLFGSEGNDLVHGLGGPFDVLAGGLGVDTLSYAIPPAGAAQGVTVDLEAAGAQDTGGAGTDTVSSLEDVVGSAFADTLRGSFFANRFELRDGVADSVTCVGGTDTVVADVEGVDMITADCETRQFDFRPDTQITSGPPDLGNDSTPTFAFQSTKDGTTFQCSLDGAAFTPCTSPHTLAPVSDGAHSFAVRARDMLGALDLSPAVRAFSVDTSGAETAPSPAAPAIDRTAPGLTGVSLLRTRFRVGRSPTVGTARRRRALVGTAFRFRLSEAASVRVALRRAAAGRQSRGRCLRPTRRLRPARRCTRFVAVRGGALTRRNLAAGRGRIGFSGRIGRRALRPGRYRATLTATDLAGNRSRAHQVSFRVVR